MPTQNKYDTVTTLVNVQVYDNLGRPKKSIFKKVPAYKVGKPIVDRPGTVISRKAPSRRDLHRMEVASRKHLK